MEAILDYIAMIPFLGEYIIIAINWIMDFFGGLF